MFYEFPFGLNLIVLFAPHVYFDIKERIEWRKNNKFLKEKQKYVGHYWYSIVSGARWPRVYWYVQIPWIIVMLIPLPWVGF